MIKQPHIYDKYFTGQEMMGDRNCRIIGKGCLIEQRCNKPLRISKWVECCNLPKLHNGNVNFFHPYLHRKSDRFLPFFSHLCLICDLCGDHSGLGLWLRH
ncbi:MAG: hypothetical protein PUP93_20900 [Rhizonema sp. NSF051]|nr:hypothetical protein [Rhizonema sp. NSF051]